jgi:hypothetical protein
MVNIYFEEKQNEKGDIWSLKINDVCYISIFRAFGSGTICMRAIRKGMYHFGEIILDTTVEAAKAKAITDTVVALSHINNELNKYFLTEISK